MPLVDETLGLDDLADYVTIANDATSPWPDAWIEFSITWHPPEPDVGIFDPTPEVKRWVYFLEANEKGFPPRRFTNQGLFVAALHREIKNDIAETYAELLAIIRGLENDAIAKLEKP